jgi:lipopolysaccharide/colanic/teichoic acid biosynthesis glycosyltransferase
MSLETLSCVLEDDGTPSEVERPDGRVGDQLLSEALFRSALVRERKRVDRSNQPLALILIGLRDGGDTPEARLWRPVVDALRATKGDTDVLGWFRQRTTIGLLVTQVEAKRETFVADISARIHCDLALRMDPQDVDRLTLQVGFHPEPATAEAGVQTVDAFIDCQPETSYRLSGTVKRALDIAGSAALLLALAPLLLLIAALVKVTSRGPVFFRQTRIGERAVPFRMLKFRTMKPNASDASHQDYVAWFIKSSGDAGASGNAVFKMQNDPRITPVGRILRRTSLDELPQLWNVLRGEMSLVGPRPPLQYEVDQYQAWHCRRVRDAKPGITGLWQVTGRSRTTFDDMVRLDLRYAKARSIWLDLKILLATPRAVIGGKGAC